jgi:hypothetical protein
VGGWFGNLESKSAGTIPDPGSNFAAGRGETIDIWGPICTMIGDDPDTPGANITRGFCGTSAATPVVSGVAALIWAANPQLSNHQVWDIMNRHAIKAGSIRRVHAYRAVREALMSTRENAPPAVRILSPAPNASLSQAVPTKFVVDAYDVEDEGSCCVATWTINGALSGSEHSFEGDPLGKKEIQVTITDKGGKKATASVTAVLSNKAPGVKITKAPAGVVTQGLAARFIAGVFDDTSVAALPVSDSPLCGGVVWTSNVDPGLHAAGCDVNIAFKTAGTHILTATVTDKYNATGTDQRTVGVTVAAPSVLAGSILAPADGQSFHDTERIVLRWTAIGVTGVPKTLWTLTDDETGQKQTIATTAVDGMDTFRIGDVFPKLTNNIGFRRFTLALTLTTSSGQAAHPVVTQISLRPVIH